MVQPPARRDAVRFDSWTPHGSCVLIFRSSLRSSLRAMSLEDPVLTAQSQKSGLAVPESHGPVQDFPTAVLSPEVPTASVSPSPTGPATTPLLPTEARTAAHPPPSGPSRHPRRIVDLPPPDSDEWEAAELPPPPSAKKATASASRRAR